MSLYEQFKTDPASEIEGIILDYGDSKIKVARAGGENKEYQKLLEKRTRAFRKASTMPEAETARILREVFAETIVKEWHTKVDGVWKSGIENPEGGALLPVTPQNIIKTFEALPDFFLHVVDQVTTATNFLEARLEEERKN